jgi:hypothetical protein
MIQWQYSYVSDLVSNKVALTDISFTVVGQGAFVSPSLRYCGQFIVPNLQQYLRFNPLAPELFLFFFLIFAHSVFKSE